MERQVDGQPIVFKYRNNDLYLYKPDYSEEEDLVVIDFIELSLECKALYCFSFRKKIYGVKC